MKRKPKTALQKRIDNPRSPYWKKRADALWAELIHMQGRCAMLGSRNHVCAGPLEAHHIISRGVVHLRHEPINGLLLCCLGHKWCKHQSPHSAPIGFTAWLEANRTAQWAWVRANKWATGRPDYQTSALALEVLIRQHKLERKQP